MTDQRRFTEETERFRRELIAYCYRMAGSTGDAEDLVQEAYLRAWRAYATFEGRASMRTWLYKIATNVCITALESRRIRVLPSGLGGPAVGDRPPTDIADALWLEPFPHPTDAIIARESVRLALIASLQHLPASQRAVFILRELLEFSAEETAALLDTTVTAVKSSLQRVRARLDELEPTRKELLEPTDPRARELLDGYIAAFERSDASLLERVLRADATLEATPFRDWEAGRVGCIRLLGMYILGAPGDWRMEPTIANGQPAARVYRRDEHGAMQPNGIVVLAVTPNGVSSVVAFHHDPRLTALFV